MDNDFLDIEVDTDDFIREEIIQIIKSLRKKLTDAGINFITIGKYKNEIHIYLRDLYIKEEILLFLTDREKEYVTFDRL